MKKRMFNKTKSEEKCMDILMEIPTIPGAYWFCCDVRDGAPRVCFTDSTSMHRINAKNYFVGPILKPIIGDNGKL
jgi:hypothetical protein